MNVANRLDDPSNRDLSNTVAFKAYRENLPVVMNILYHLRSFPKLSESFILNEIYALVERSHQVAVFAFNDPENDIMNSEFESIDIPIRYADSLSMTDTPRTAQKLLFQPSLIRHSPRNPKLAIRDLFFARQLLDYIEDLGWKPDVVHGHFASSMRTSAQIATATLGIPHTITAHANDIYPRQNRSTACRVLTAADRVMTVCESNRRFIESELGVPTPVDIVPASIRFEKFNPSPSSVDGRVLTVARLTKKKGIEYGIDAIREVRETRPDVSYHVIGSGELRTKLEERKRSEDLEDHVSLLGRVSEERLLRELDEAQVFVLPSVITENGDRDATPVVLKEAMAMGTPCVSTDVCGIPEIVDHGENGLLVPPRDVDVLSDAVESLLTDDERRARMGRNARKKASSFDIDRTIERLEESFETVGQLRR